MRALSDLERRILQLMCPTVATDGFLDSSRVTPANADRSIVDVHPAAGIARGMRIVELAHGVFRDREGTVCGYALLLGDEKGVPRQLDLHGIRDGLSVADLAPLELTVL